VTLTASPSCAVVTDSVSGQPVPFPESVRVRRYDGEFANGAAILTAADGTGNRVSIGGIDHYIYSGMPLMSVTGNQLTIFVPGDINGFGQPPTCTGGDYWWEFLSQAPGENEVFELCGTWQGSMEDPTRIDGAISGAFVYYRGVGPHWKTDLFCTAFDHHFTLTRR
jgi:hypothetical protein